MTETTKSEIANLNACRKQAGKCDQLWGVAGRDENGGKLQNAAPIKSY